MESFHFDWLRQLIVVTGTSASGKTTFARKIGKKYNIEVFSLDDYKDEVYEKYGFKNETERLLMRELAISRLKADLISQARIGESIITEYPFDSSWQNFFSFIAKEYGYELIVINCTRDFDATWETIVERYSGASDRKASLTAAKYVCGKVVEPKHIIDDDFKQERYRKWKNSQKSRIIGDHNFKVKN